MKSLSFLFAALGASLSAVTLESGSMRIGISDECAIERIECRAPDGGFVRFVSPSAGDAPFWALTFWKDGDAKSAVRLTNRSACRVRRMEKGADGGATFVWDGLDLPGEKGAATVRATVALAADGASRWTLDVQNQSAAYGLAETQFPVLERVSQSGEADVLLPRPDLGARLLRRRAHGGRAQRFGCMGYYPMMAAFMKDGAGLYVAAHDSEARIKTLVVSEKNDVSFTTPVENAGVPGKAAPGPRYAVTIAPFTGDWWNAARLYRSWALTTKWTAKGPIHRRPDYPKRMAEIPLWLNIHGGPAEVSNVMSRVRAVFPGVDAGIHWHLWQHSPHDVNYPEYFPEQPGTKECLAYCRSIGQEAMPYTNGRLWSVPLMSYPYVRPFAIAGPDCSPRVEKYGPVTPPLSPMCPWTDKWDDTLNDFAGRVLDLGAGSLFLDQIGACAGAPCYAKSHGHPIGGGTWYFEGYQKILAKAHARYSSTNAFLTTEGSGEQWMNVVDGYLTVTQRRPEDVPFFHAVYSGYTTYFCSPENHEDDDVSFRAAQTRELLWGQALGWYHPLILDSPSKCDIVRRLVDFRQRHLDCFAYGTLLGEVAFEGAVPDVDVTWLGRKPFWAWKMPDYPLSATIRGKVPSVCGYVWKSATTGRERLFLANLSERPQNVRHEWRGKVRSATLAPGALTAVDLQD